MFFVGDPEQTAQLYRDQAFKANGPSVPELHYEEMEEEDLRNLFAYLYLSLQKALTDAADDGTIGVLMKDYDAVFQALAEVSEDFREVVRTGRHRYITGYESESIEKYRKLAGVA